MKQGQSRFFLNWQFSKEMSSALFNIENGQSQDALLNNWINRNITFSDFKDDKQNIYLNYLQNAHDFTIKQQFTEQKMSCFLEIMWFLLIQLKDERVTEQQSFTNFKELLLRHSVQRPPHSLSIFNLDDVKAINEYVQETLYRYYNFYLYAITPKTYCQLESAPLFHIEEPDQERLENGKIIPPREIEDLKLFFSEAELAQIEKENEYMLRGPGRIERIMREELDKLSFHMEDRIRKQDEEFMQKIAPAKK
eukprot:403362250